jgi:hypothetical protein
MVTKDEIQRVLEELPEDRVHQVLDFARYVSQANEAEEWRSFGKSQFAKCFGNDEPEYSEADIKPQTK